MSIIGLTSALVGAPGLAADTPAERLPDHLRGSSIATWQEIGLVERWAGTTAGRTGKGAGWVDGWLGGALPFSLRCDGKPFDPADARWQRSRTGPTAESGAAAEALTWTDAATGLKLTWHLKRFADLPAVEWVLTIENTGKADSPLIEDVQALDLRLKHSRRRGDFVVHGANGGRSSRDDLMPFSVAVPQAQAEPDLSLHLLRQDACSLERNQSAVQTPLKIGEQRFAHGLGTHAVSHIRLTSAGPIARFSAWVGVDNNPRGGGGTVVFTVRADGKEVYRSGVLRTGGPAEKVDVDTGGARVLELLAGDAGDGITCDHADWAEAAITLQGGKAIRLDEIPASWENALVLGSSMLSSNNHLPFFNVETPEGRGVAVGIGWTGAWQARLAREGSRLGIQASLPSTRFRLRPGEKVRLPRILLVLWEGERLHGQNLLRRTLHRHYVPRLQGKPQQPLVSVNACFTYNGKGGYLTQATEETLLPLVKPMADLGVEAFVIDAGWYECKEWTDILSGANFRVDKTRYPRGIRAVAEPVLRSGIRFGLWFPPESYGTFADPANRERFLGQVDERVQEEGMNYYRQDHGILPAEEGEDRVGVGEMRHIAGLYAMQDELRRRHPDMLMEGCCGGGRRIDLESLSRFHWHQKSDRWYDTESDQAGLYGANLFLPGAVINVPTEAMDAYGLWSSFAGQLCLGWDLADPAFPVAQQKEHVALYKRIRPLLSGDFYPLTECTLTDRWLAFEFHHPEQGAGVAMIYKRAGGAGNTFTLRLRGLDPEARYTLTCQAAGTKLPHTGADLAKGVDVTVSQTPGAELALFARE